MFWACLTGSDVGGYSEAKNEYMNCGHFDKVETIERFFTKVYVCKYR